MNDTTALRERVREAIRRGELPLRPPDRTWGGAGTGAPCAVCRNRVAQSEIELEAELEGDPGAETLRVHQPCFQAWQAEWRELAAEAERHSPDPLAAED